MGFFKKLVTQDLQSFGWNDPQYWVPIAVRAARLHELEPEIVIAVILHESKGDPLASRPEQGFYTKYLGSKSKEQLGGKWPRTSRGIIAEMLERYGRAVSYGHMQVMGQTARELGFDGEHIWELCEPNINIEIGCKKLKSCFRSARKLNIEGIKMIRVALLQYNGGATPEYPDLVLQYINNGRAEELMKYAS